jgi:hypothetical protein
VVRTARLGQDSCTPHRCALRGSCRRALEREARDWRCEQDPTNGAADPSGPCVGRRAGLPQLEAQLEALPHRQATIPHRVEASLQRSSVRVVVRGACGAGARNSCGSADHSPRKLGPCGPHPFHPPGCPSGGHGPWPGGGSLGFASRLGVEAPVRLNASSCARLRRQRFCGQSGPSGSKRILPGSSGDIPRGFQGAAPLAPPQWRLVSLSSATPPLGGNGLPPWPKLQHGPPPLAPHLQRRPERLSERQSDSSSRPCHLTLRPGQPGLGLSPGGAPTSEPGPRRSHPLTLVGTPSSAGTEHAHPLPRRSRRPLNLPAMPAAQSQSGTSSHSAERRVAECLVSPFGCIPVPCVTRHAGLQGKRSDRQRA